MYHLRVCQACRQPFQAALDEQFVCDPCTPPPPKESETCMDHLHWPEGMMECFIAKKGHPGPHLWRGELGGRMVSIEWE